MPARFRDALPARLDDGRASASPCGRRLVFDGSVGSRARLPAGGASKTSCSGGPSLPVLVVARSRRLAATPSPSTAVNRSRACLGRVPRRPTGSRSTCAPAHPADVQLGGFDRYEVYDAQRAPGHAGPGDAGPALRDARRAAGGDRAGAHRAARGRCRRAAAASARTSSPPPGPEVGRRLDASRRCRPTPTPRAADARRPLAAAAPRVARRGRLRRKSSRELGRRGPR